MTTTFRKKRGTIGKSFGLKWGLNLKKTWIKLLRQADKERRTELWILEQMRLEFPGRRKFEVPSKIRSYYNRGSNGFENPDGEHLVGWRDENAMVSRGRVPKGQAAEGPRHQRAIDLSRIPDKRLKEIIREYGLAKLTRSRPEREKLIMEALCKYKNCP